jgi:hypothetical protein
MDAQHPVGGGGEASGFRLDDFFNAGEVLQKDPKLDAINFFGWTLLRCMFASKANG